MAKRFGIIGHCARCGDTEGPWTVYKGIGLLCDMCAEEEDKRLDARGDLKNNIDWYNKENHNGQKGHR